MTSIPLTPEVDLAAVQVEAITARDGGFHQVPVFRCGTWGVLERTPHGTDFIPTPSLEQATALVTSEFDC